ncbi:MerR family transcriptional regulator [Streptomyces sp. NP160]|uniref:MerR family transcriptional regulator n=1 Tax=Streptomyces sp. NP160 TaxID=2586637 RepID=UPI001117EC6B|nr:MerR family transcriptional regulator [Streptomyces sp. NP160]TNM68441.1 MerR family transcriptional regulator [Streptomyces sp. NP160]
MRIGELSQRTGVPVATLKHYLREGLLPRGRATARTQAEYGEEHVHRLRLVQALTEVGGLTLAATRTVLDAVTTPGTSVTQALGVATEALPPRPAEDADLDLAPAQRALELAGWDTWPDSAPVRQLATAMRALEAAGLDASPELVAERARLLAPLVREEVAAVPDTSIADAATFAALGTVLYEPLLLALRRLGHQDASVRRFGHPGQRPT